MTSADWNQDLVGRGVRDGARLFRDWFSSLTDIANGGQGAAYVLVMGNMNEVLRSFDMPIVFPEINALQTAIRHVSGEYLELAEDYGYSPDICGYVKADVAIQLRGGEHPMARIPKPSMAVVTNTCNTYIKWAEIWGRFYDIPTVMIDIPGTRAAGCQSQPGDEEFIYECRYVARQIKELIVTCETVTGRKFDIDKFRERLRLGNEMTEGWHKVLEMNRSRPALFNSLTDGTVFLGMANCFRATEEGSRFFKDLVEEMSYRADNGIGAMVRVNGADVPLDQRFRLAFIGVPCYPIFRSFNEMFSKWGGVFVTSAYLTFASGGSDSGFQYDLANPIDSYAEGVLRNLRGTMDSLFYSSPGIETDLDKFGLDGIVYHPVKSCRTVSAGLADRRLHVMKEHGISTLFIESDLVDPRVVSEAQTRNRVDAFFEGLISRRQADRASP